MTCCTIKVCGIKASFSMKFWIYFLRKSILTSLLIPLAITYLSTGETFISSIAKCLQIRETSSFNVRHFSDCLFICWLLFRALTLWIIVGSNQANWFRKFTTILYIFLQFMLHINSTINPILYSAILKLCSLRVFGRKWRKMHTLLLIAWILESTVN